MSAFVFTPLDLNAVDRSEDDIYVVNYSDQGNARPRGIVHLEVKDGDVSTPIIIKNFGIPFNLCEHASRDAIRRSPQFREFVRKKILLVVSEKEALAALESPVGKAIKVRADADGAISHNKHLDSPTVTVSLDSTSIANQDQAPKIKSAESNIGGQKVAGVIEGFRAGLINEADAIAQLEHLYGTNEAEISDFQANFQLLTNPASEIYQVMVRIVSSQNAPSTNEGGGPRIYGANGAVVTFRS